MRWTPVDEAFGREERRKLPTHGYDEYTRIEAEISITGALRYQRLDQARCVKESCPCSHLVTADISVDLRTLGVSARATGHGEALSRQARPEMEKQSHARTRNTSDAAAHHRIDVLALRLVAGLSEPD